MFFYRIFIFIYSVSLRITLCRQNRKLTCSRKYQQIAAHYHTGKISDFLIGNVNWHNTVSEAEILIFNNPEELSGYSPFSKEDKPIISKAERKKLLKGEYIVKKGYEEKFERNLIGAIVPLIDQKTNELAGIVYLYVPLASLNEVFTKAANILAIVAVITFIFLYLIGNRITKAIVNPLQRMKTFSNEIAKGNFSIRIPSTSNDEVGHLAEAFNSMASSLKKVMNKSVSFLQTSLMNYAHRLAI
ncbi:HAMP domain-containing protein [Priestia flexa]|nr:HAMP domain-containing protein [Priestia flexa]